MVDEHGTDDSRRARPEPSALIGVGDSPVDTDRNVVLTGFMGTGKTTVGRLVATRLGFEFVDTDRLIESRHGPIPEIFRDHGEDAFRSFERDAADELSARRSLVISTGGRLMLDARNAAALGSTGRVFCLTASIDTILARVMADGATDRPLLSGDDVRERAESLLADRTEGYGRFAQVSTEERSLDDVVDEIINRL